MVINVGDSVHWSGLLNGFHTVAEVADAASSVYNGGFHSAPLASEFTFVFNAAGVFHYVCEPHAPNMRGTVTVNEVIPTVSTWGVAALVLLVLVAGSVVFRRMKLAR